MQKYQKVVIERKKVEDFEPEFVSLNNLNTEDFFALSYEGAHFKVSIDEADAEIRERDFRKALLYVEPEKAVAYIIRFGLINNRFESASLVASLLGVKAEDVVEYINEVNEFIAEEFVKLDNDDPKTVKKYHNTPDTTFTEILEDYIAEDRKDKDSRSYRYLNMIVSGSKETKKPSKSK